MLKHAFLNIFFYFLALLLQKSERNSKQKNVPITKKFIKLTSLPQVFIQFYIFFVHLQPVWSD